MQSVVAYGYGGNIKSIYYNINLNNHSVTVLKKKAVHVIIICMPITNLFFKFSSVFCGPGWRNTGILEIPFVFPFHDVTIKTG